MLKNIGVQDDCQYWYDTKPVTEDVDHPIYLVVKLESTKHWGDDPDKKWHMELFCVGPQYPTDKNLESYIKQSDLTVDKFKAMQIEDQLSALVDCHLCGRVWQAGGNNKNHLLKQVRSLIPEVKANMDTYMETKQNAIGETAWKWMKGV